MESNHIDRLVVKVVPPTITKQEREARIKRIKQVAVQLWINAKQPASVTKRVAP